MLRKFQHEETKEIIKIELPMAEDIPKEIEQDGKIYKFVSEFLDSAIHIPLGFQSSETIRNRPHYAGHGPRGKKRIW